MAENDSITGKHACIMPLRTLHLGNPGFKEKLREELESLEAQEDRIFRANEDNDLADLYGSGSEVWL